jgi:hypothetical protein
LFSRVAMAHVKSTTRYVGGGSGGEDCGSGVPRGQNLCD